jgi:hypothetical protein
MVSFVMLYHWTGPVWAEGHHQFTIVSDYVKPPTIVFIGFERTINDFSAFKLSHLFLAFFGMLFIGHGIRSIIIPE